MSNKTTSNPIVLDTVGATSIYRQDINVTCVLWTGMTTTGHRLIIKDALGGNVLVDMTTQTLDPIVLHFADTFPVHGLYLDTLGSGIAYVYS